MMRTEHVMFVGRAPMFYTCGRSGKQCAIENKRLRIEKINIDPTDATRLVCDIFCRTCGEWYGCKRIAESEAEACLTLP